MVTVSPAVSPSVVAAILMIQNTSVTSGTLLAVRSTRLINRPPMRSDAARRQYYSQRFLSMVWLSLASVRKNVLRAAATLTLCCAVLSGFSIPALAGPPYLTDDPEPTDYKHFEIYTFSQGMATPDGIAGEGGIDFNYGGAPNLQLTATVPAAYNFPTSG